VEAFTFQRGRFHRSEAAIGLSGFETDDLFRDCAVRDGQWGDTLGMAHLRKR